MRIVCSKTSMCKTCQTDRVAPTVWTGRMQSDSCRRTGLAAVAGPRFSSRLSSPIRTRWQRDSKVFTTRPDTLFGATFMVVAPGHPIVNVDSGDDCLVPSVWPAETRAEWKGADPSLEIREAVSAYIAESSNRTAQQKREEREKDGGLCRLACSQSCKRGENSRLHRRLRQHGLRHRRDYGRPSPRRARP